jgi:hypothetical protein
MSPRRKKKDQRKLGAGACASCYIPENKRRRRWKRRRRKWMMRGLKGVGE